MNEEQNAGEQVEVCIACGRPALTIEKEEYLELCANVGAAYSVTLEQLQGASKEGSIVKARAHCYALLMKLGLSSARIGRLLNKDHSTVLHGAKKHAERIAKSRKATQLVEE